MVTSVMEECVPQGIIARQELHARTITLAKTERTMHILELKVSHRVKNVIQVVFAMDVV